MRATPGSRRTARLLRGFDRAVVGARDFLDARYGPGPARNLITAARQEYARVIPELPDLHGGWPFSKWIAAAGWFLAFHRALARNGRPVREAGELAYAVTAQFVGSFPWIGKRLIRWLWFSKLFQMRLRFRARTSQKHRKCGEYVYEYVEGDAPQFNFGVDYIECAVWTFLQSQKAPELAPYVCALDQLQSDAFGWGLVRTTTLAEGGSRCDFRFKRGGKTSIVSTVLSLQA